MKEEEEEEEKKTKLCAQVQMCLPVNSRSLEE